MNTSECVKYTQLAHSLQNKKKKEGEQSEYQES